MNQFYLKLIFLITITHSFFDSLQSAPATAPTIVTRASKAMLPADLSEEAKKEQLSILRPLPADLPLLYQNYPDGSVLFPHNPTVAIKFNTMVAAIKKNPKVIEFFRKIHMLALNKLYEYIMKIYTNLNITSPGCDQTLENPTANVIEYLADQATYATNKKKLLINHFLNILQAQFGASIVSYVPATQPDMAVTLGSMFIQNDHSIDLTIFTTSQTDPVIIASNKELLQFLYLYIDFFQDYTSYLAKFDTNGVNQYYTMAQSIQNFTTKTPMNPSMFFYDTESMRSIQFIPFVSGTIPKDSKLIPWAPVIVNAAVKNLQVNNQPIAFFKDAAGNKTAKQQDAKSLYLLVAVGPNIFEEELLAQPAWMNTQDGSIRILQACLGNFAALLGLGILDTTLETIIRIGTNPEGVALKRPKRSDTSAAPTSASVIKSTPVPVATSASNTAATPTTNVKK